MIKKNKKDLSAAFYARTVKRYKKMRAMVAVLIEDESLIACCNRRHIIQAAILEKYNLKVSIRTIYNYINKLGLKSHSATINNKVLDKLDRMKPRKKHQS